MYPDVARPLHRHAGVLTASSERPRERLLEHGAEALASKELIALILGSGVAGRSALEISANVLDHAGGLVALSRAVPRELARLPGIGMARASRLAAAFQLGQRAMAEPMSDRFIRDAEDVFQYLQPRMRGLMQEVFVAIALDARNAIISHVEIARGSLTAVEVHPREVFRPLIRHGAAGAVVAHNHPSGDPRPSPHDLALTRRLRRAGVLVGIPVLDHIVVGAQGYSSIAELVGVEEEDWEAEW